MPTFRVVASSFHSSQYSALTLCASWRLQNFEREDETLPRVIEDIFFSY